jgi:hypothetical protein
VGLRGRLNKLRQEAEDGAVVVHLKDGTARYFEDMDVATEMFLAKMALFRDEVPDSPVLDAVRAATPESRKAFEEKYGPIEMSVAIVDPDWAEVITLLEDGTVQKTRHEGDEAENIREEARRKAQGSSFL